MNKIIAPKDDKIVVNRSRFLGFVFYCENNLEKQRLLKDMKSKFPSATHICHACINFDGESSSDDREPSGTAGLPILNVLKSACVMNALIVVVRFFGGVKLGVSGLIDAYQTCAKLTLVDNLADAKIMREYVCVSPYIDYGKAKKLVENMGGKITHENFGIEVEFTALLDEKNKIADNTDFKISKIGGLVLV